jgi:hypothetical protein
MYKQGRTGVIIAVFVLILLVGLTAIGAYLGSNQETNAGGFGKIFNTIFRPATSTTPVATTTPGTIDTATFRATYVTGFEGDNTTVSYEITYPKSTFAVSASSTGASTINLIEGSRTHSISIINDVAIGLNSSREAYEALGASSFCAGCVEASTAFRPIAGTDVRAWQSATREVIIYKQAPGYVIIRMIRPSEAARSVAATLRITTKAGGTIEDSGTTNVKIHLVKDANVSCSQTVAKSRNVPQTSAPATAAINLLLQEGGYPAGSKLNSLKITNGVAYADFNNTTQSGGGSCAMAARVAQIRNTLLQFPTITKVVITVAGASEEDSFQP